MIENRLCARYIAPGNPVKYFTLAIVSNRHLFHMPGIKLIALMSALVFILSGTLTKAQIVNFDSPGGLGGVNYSGQGAVSDPGNNYWNPIARQGITTSGLLSDGVTSTPITLTDNSPSSYNPGQGAQGTPGGLEGPFLLENSGSVITDTLSNVPAGTYNLYLYGKNDDGGDADRGTTFTAFTSATPATTQSTVNSVTATFTEGDDYVVFSNLVVGANGTITFTYTANAAATGTFNPQNEGDFNGLQLVPLVSQLTVSVVANEPASSVQGTIATLNGKVVNPGEVTATVTLFYGPTDGGSNPASWANSISLGLQGGAFAQTITGLTPNSTYYFAAEAVNAAGSGWGTPSQEFTTVATNSPWPSVAVLTQHNDGNRSGDNLNETTLNVKNVNTNSFGLLYTRPVDDQIYAQPLIMTNVSILGHGSRNLLIVATVNDSIYAYDADDSTVTEPYWKDSFISPPNVVAPNNADESAIGACGGDYLDFSGNFGIVGTPVIDPVNQTLYVVVRTKETSGGTTSFIQRLHALNVATGAEQPNSPVVITATYPGTGDGGSVISFDPLRQNQRPGLALANGVIYITWSSHCDNTPYHGWVIGYSVTNLQQTVVWNDSPNGSEAGIWMSGQAPNVDTNGNIYVSVGNGTVDTTTHNDYGESFLKLVPANGTMQLASYFIPYNYASLNSGDLDLGDAGMLLIPGTTLGISGGKAGVLYLVNRDKMGGLSSGSADTNVLQTWSLGSGQIHGAPVWCTCTNGSFLYIWTSSGNHLRQYQFTNTLFNTKPYSQSPSVGGSGSPGGVLSVSANGTNAGTGIVWATVNTTANANQGVVAGTLHAFSAQSVTNELWNSDMVPGRDSLGNLAKFVPPTVANGKVYVATFSGEVGVYGLLPPPALTIVSSKNQTTISWPTNAYISFTLQSSTNLISGNWKNVGNALVVTNGVNQVTVPATVPAMFYRLLQ